MTTQLRAATRLRVISATDIQLTFYPALSAYVKDAANVKEPQKVIDLLNKARLTDARALNALDKWLAKNGKRVPDLEEALSDDETSFASMGAGEFTSFKRLFNVIY